MENGDVQVKFTGVYWLILSVKHWGNCMMPKAEFPTFQGNNHLYE